MSHARSTRWRRSPASFFAGITFTFAAVLGAFPSCNNTETPNASAPQCGPEAYFADTAWPQVFSTCIQCHVAGGVSGITRFVLKPLSSPGAMQTNFRIVQHAARKL